MSSTPQEQGIIFEQKKKEKRRILIMAALLGICCALTYYFHVVLGVGTVFTHFFYVPIILASLWWRRKGLIIAMFLALMLIFSHFFVRAEMETVNDLIRAPMFIVVALAVAILSERIAKAGAKLKNYAKDLENAVEEQTKGLAKEHNYVRHLIESSPDFQMTLDKNSRIMDVNEAFEHIAGKSREDVIGTSIFKYLPKEETEKVIAEIFEKGKVRNIELTVDIPGKGSLISNLSGTIFTTPEGELGIYVTGRDITEHKHADEALERKILALTQPVGDLSGLKLTDIIDTEILQEVQDDFARYHGVASVILDHNGEPITEASNLSEFCSILRSTPKGLEKCMRSDARLGKMTAKGSPAITSCQNFKEIMDGAVPIYIKGRHLGTWGMGQVLTEKLDIEEVRRYAREVGADEDKLVEASRKLKVGPKDEFEKVVSFLSTMAKNISLLGLQNLQQARYITERKHLIKELDESRKFLETVIENIPDAVYLKDSQYHFSLVNRAYCDRFGVTKEEIIGKERFRETDKELFQTGKAIEIPEQSFIDRKGECHYTHLKKVPLTDESGNVTHVLTISRDITEHTHADDEREALLKDLEKTNRKLAARAKELEESRRATLNMALDIEKTKQELQESMTKLERFNRLAVDRELKMIELKKEVNRLCEQLGEKTPYNLSFVDNKITNEELRITNPKLELRCEKKE